MIDFEELFIKNDPVQTLRNFQTSRVIAQREVYARVLECILQTESPELILTHKDDILETLDAIASDIELEVRAALVGNGNMISICTCLTQLDQSFVQSFGVFLLDHILLIVLRYLSDRPTVRKSANTTLLYLIENGFLDKKVINRTVCPVILDLLKINKTDGVNNSIDHDIHLNAIGIMAKVAPLIGTDATHDKFFNKFLMLTQCETPSIRKQCASVFPVMCEVLGSELLESSMMPLFVKLCDDPSWDIRNACAQIIPMMSILCSLSLRREYLVPIMKKFMFDESRWVITSTLNSLGEFLATFAQPPIIGLAYNYRLELFVTNASDQDFRQQYHSNMLLYSNQPNSSVIFKNLEYYEKEFEKEFVINDIQSFQGLQPHSFPAVCKSMTSTSSSSSQDLSKKINIETYLLSIIKANHFNDRMNTSGGRLSSTTASESDECELFSIQNSFNPATLLKRLSASSVGCDGNDEGGRERGDDNNNDDDPFCRFMRYNTPLKNNFVNRILTPDNSDTTFVWHMGLGSGIGGVEHDIANDEDEEYEVDRLNIEQDDDDDDDDDDITDFDGRNNLNKTVKSYISEDSNGGTDSVEKMFNDLTLRDKLNNNLDGDDSELEKFNSHQFWYIAPPTIEDELIIEANELNNNDEPTSPIAADQSTLPMTEDEDDNESNDSMKVTNGDPKEQLSLKLPKTDKAEDDDEDEEKTPPPRNDNAEVEWNLVEDFVYMKDIDNDLCYKCAYNFPAVMLTLGKRFWPILHQHFLSLCNDLQSSVRVRKTMAKSIYQIALIIGSRQATIDLVAPFVEFFKDVDEIKIEVVKQVSKFIKIVDSSKHEIILNQLELCWHPSIHVVNWRLREQIGVQVIELNKLGPRIKKENCLLYLTGLSLKLMMDKYDCVRKVGIDAFVSCVQRIKQKKQLLKFLSFHFANSSRWRERQVYVMTVDKLLEQCAIKPEMFNNYILKKLIELAVDKIPNIRLCIAKCLSKGIMENPYYNRDFRDSNLQIQKQINALEKDPDRDVRDNIFSPFNENEKTMSPSSDDISLEQELPPAPDASSSMIINNEEDFLPLQPPPPIFEDEEEKREEVMEKVDEELPSNNEK